MRIRKAKDLAIAVSLANLCFIKIWSFILCKDNSYYSKGPNGIDCAASMLNVILVGGILWLLIILIRKSNTGLISAFSYTAFFLILVIPLNGIRSLFSLFKYGNTVSLLGEKGVWIAIILTASVLFCMLVRWHREAFKLISTLLLFFIPLVLTTFLMAGWALIKQEPKQTFGDKPTAPLVKNRPNSRVVWLVFDEMDQRLTFTQRPLSLRLPEIDRLRNQAIYATNAFPPADETLLSLPALLTGKLVNQATPSDADELSITFSGSREGVRWSYQPDIFLRARELGFNSGLTGWGLPYCRVIGDHLNICSWEPDNFINDNQALDLSGTMLKQIRVLMETTHYALFGRTTEIQSHIDAYLRILSSAIKMANNQDLGVIVAHFPIPHSSFIYDRFANTFVSRGRGFDGYLDNLALVNSALGELRRNMEKAGLWENTTIIMTSDHWWRDSDKFDGKVDHRVPFLIKLPGQKETALYEKPFNTVLIHDIILSLLKGEILSPKSLMDWLDDHRHLIDPRPQKIKGVS